jgi:hypothetical protein
VVGVYSHVQYDLSRLFGDSLRQRFSEFLLTGSIPQKKRLNADWSDARSFR